MTEDSLARWRAEEQAVRARLAAPGSVRAEQVRGRTGLEMLQAIFAGELPSPLIGETLDFVPIRIEPGERKESSSTLVGRWRRPKRASLVRTASSTRMGPRPVWSSSSRE